MDWNTFTQNLGDTLTSLTNGTVLIVVAKPAPMVMTQFMVSEQGAITVQTGTDWIVPDDLRVGADEEDLFTGAGWVRDDQDRRLWSRTIDFLADDAAVRSLADACVWALRDVRHCPSPDFLMYRSWRTAQEEPEYVDPDIAETLDWGEIPVLWQQLGLDLDEQTVAEWRKEYPKGHFDPFPDYELEDHDPSPR